MDKKDLEKIADYTERNYHTEARVYIASLFPFCAKFKKMFELIKELHDMTGHLDYNLSLYRESLTDSMLRGIAITEGERVAIELNSVI